MYRLHEQNRRKAAHLIVGVLFVTILVLSGPARAAESEIDHLAQILEIGPGSSIADVGAGSGEVSVALANFVAPNGTVYATEIDPSLRDKIRRVSQKAKATEVVVVAGNEHETGLPLNSCDAIFLREVYHHLSDPVEMDRSLYQAMRPGARLAIIDFEPSQRPGEPVPPGVPANRGGHGVTIQIVKEELTRAGFQFVKTIDWPISATIRHYCIIFRKP